MTTKNTTHRFIPADGSEFYNLYGTKVPIIGHDIIQGKAIPRLGLKMMSDEEWQSMAISKRGCFHV